MENVYDGITCAISQSQKTGSSMCIRQLPLFLFCLSILLCNQVNAVTKIVIAENGSGHGLLEHTLPAVTLAAARNVDYLELHVAMTADDELLVYRDLTLNRLSNVADVFPERIRTDGNYYVIDFTLNEIRQLRLRNEFESNPLSLSLGIPSLKEELSLIRKLETIFNRKIGITLEINDPAFHKDSGKDIGNATLDILALFGYTSKEDKVFIQCLDSDELQRIHSQLMPEKKMQLSLIQLIDPQVDLPAKQQAINEKIYNYDWMFTNIGLRMVATYASAIGLPRTALADQNGTLLLSKYVEDAHRYGLKVLVFSLDEKEGQLPAFATDFPSLLNFYYKKAGIDGLYTDAFTEVLQHNKQLTAEEKWRAELPTFFSSLELSKPTSAQEKLDLQQKKTY
ncbi:MAG: glycerophosphodiester phosphodiesterase [Desulforhopalus sp.]